LGKRRHSINTGGIGKGKRLRYFETINKI
jgi:hypothetical protein